VREVDHLHLVPSLRISGAIPLLLYDFVAWKVATSLCSFYTFKYLEVLTLWHEWVLVLTAFALQLRVRVALCPTFRIPIGPYFSIVLYLAYKSLRICH
jgi:hypothetical protein